MTDHNATMDEELRQLQHAHERALRAAQRHEDTRRKRLHLAETNQNDRKQLDESMQRKRAQVRASICCCRCTLPRCALIERMMTCE